MNLPWWQVLLLRWFSAGHSLCDKCLANSRQSYQIYVIRTLKHARIRIWASAVLSVQCWQTTSIVLCNECGRLRISNCWNQWGGVCAAIVIMEKWRLIVAKTTDDMYYMNWFICLACLVLLFCQFPFRHSLLRPCGNSLRERIAPIQTVTRPSLADFQELSYGNAVRILISLTYVHTYLLL